MAADRAAILWGYVSSRAALVVRTLCYSLDLIT